MSQVGLGMRPETHEPRGRRPGRRGATAVLVAALVVIGLLVVTVTVGVRWFTNKPDYTGSGHGEVQVQVRTGDSTTQIASALERSDVVRSASAFLQVADSDPASSEIQPGTYRLHLQMSAQSAFDLLLDPSSKISSRVLIPEGLRADETIKLLAKAARVTPDSLDAALASPGDLGLPEYAHGNAEGFLFPATYDIEPGSDATRLLTQMLKRYAQTERDTDLLTRAADVHLTPYQVIVVASIVQAEGRTQDFPTIARAVLNRLAKHMKLQLNSTVNYVLKNDKEQLTSADIAARSPYNTYLVDGLPPGPIDSPGEDAINAVLSPASGNWLYWVTVDPVTKLTKFTASYAEFLRFKAELKANGG